jgi:hypothetical protein
MSLLKDTRFRSNVKQERQHQTAHHFRVQKVFHNGL